MASDRAKRFLAAAARRGETEKVLYRPARAGGRPREVDAFVTRPGFDTVMQMMVEHFRVTVLNDELLGIPTDSRLSDVGADRIDVAERRNGPTAARTARGIQRFSDADDGDWLTAEVL